MNKMSLYETKYLKIFSVIASEEHSEHHNKKHHKKHHKKNSAGDGDRRWDIREMIDSGAEVDPAFSDYARRWREQGQDQASDLDLDPIDLEGAGLEPADEEAGTDDLEAEPRSQENNNGAGGPSSQIHIEVEDGVPSSPIIQIIPDDVSLAEVLQVSTKRQKSESKVQGIKMGNSLMYGDDPLALADEADKSEKEDVRIILTFK